ncbi:MAG: alpha/beta fold hydrolase [Alphaproteobacteria bacterium]|nr:alpha/beta fold hydrolase [Alphaproteobacteria bacterium]
MSMAPSRYRITTELSVDNGQGWVLPLRRHVRPAGPDPSLRPLVLVPGYAMNSWILGYHPGGPSLIDHLALDGFEVWTVDLRGQGDARRDGPKQRFGLGELSMVDLPAMLQRVRAETASEHDRIDVIGCSLGASIVYAYLASRPSKHGLARVVAMGGPLRWVDVHPLLAVAFKSPVLAGLLPVRGTRAMARRALPIARHLPPLLSIYMNAREVDLSQPELLVNTVDDPVRYINRQIARWVAKGDLHVGGIDVSAELGRIRDVEVLVVLANRDGIVPPATARSVAAVLPKEQVQELDVGTPEHWYAHADLFIGPRAQAEVFTPMSAWLRAPLSR